MFGEERVNGRPGRFWRDTTRGRGFGGARRTAKSLLDNWPEAISKGQARDHHRRHLTVSQAAMCAQRARKMYDDAAKDRQKAAGGDRKSNGAKSLPANCPEAISTGDARDQVGETLMRRLNAKSGNPRILFWTIVQNKLAPPATKSARRSACLDR